MVEQEQQVPVLAPTRGSFRLRGVVVGLANEKAFKEGVVSKGSSKGKKWRSVRFGIKTSETNTIYVELMGMEQDQITVYRREDKEKGITKDKKVIDFSKRHNVPAGYEVIDTTFEIEKNDDGNVQRRLVRFDAILYIKKYLLDGDSVYVSGQTEFSEYTNPNTNQTRLQTRYNIQNVNKLEHAVNFEDDKFDETSSFKQQIVFLNSAEQEGRIYVQARTIQYGGKFTDVQFVVDPSVATEAQREEVEKTALAFAQYVKFGDLIDVEGNIVNRVEVAQTEEPTLSTGIFGKAKAKGYGKRAIRNYITELQIIGADEDTYEVGKYNEEDFIVKEFAKVPDAGTSKNPFENNDDLPF